MKNQNMFELATRNKIRFPFKGLISVEDLWDLSVQNLDSIFKTLNMQLKEASQESLLNVKTKENEMLELQIEIIKHIAEVKVEENNKKLKEKEVKQKKQEIIAIIESKKQASLQNMPVEDLEKMLKELEV